MGKERGKRRELQGGRDSGGRRKREGYGNAAFENLDGTFRRRVGEKVKASGGGKGEGTIDRFPLRVRTD